MVTVDFSMLSLSTKTHSSFGITLMPQKYSDADVIKMLEYLIDNIFVEFGGRIFQQTIGILMGTKCAPSLADLFLYSYEVEFVQSLLQVGKKHLAQLLNFTYRYIDDCKICRVFGIHLSTWTSNKGLQPPPHTWIAISTLTIVSLLPGFTTNEMTSIPEQ